MDDDETGSPSPWTRIDPAFLARVGDLTPDRLLSYHDGAEADWRHGAAAEIPSLPLGDLLFQALGRHREAWKIELESRKEPTVQLEGDESTEARVRAPRHAVHVLNGPTGEGKTTLLLQLATRLGRLAEWTVLWLRPGCSSFSPEEALELLPEDGSGVLVVDLAHEQVLSLHRLLRLATSRSVQVLAASRENDWSFVRGRDHGWQALGASYAEHDEIEVDEGAARALIAGYEALGSAGLGPLGALPADSRADRLLAGLKEARETEGRSLFGALLTVRHDADSLQHAMDALVKRVVEGEAGRERARVLAAIALVDSAEIDGLDPRILATAVGIDGERLDEEILAPLAGEAAISFGGEGSVRRLWMRDPRLADALTCALQASSSLPAAPDIATTLAELATAAIALGGEHDDLLHHRELVHLSRRVQRTLGRLIGDAPAAEVALHVADATCELGGRVDLHAERLLAMTRAGRSQEAADSALLWFGKLRELEDHDLSIRSFMAAWGRLEWDLGNPDLGTWLVLHSLSDELIDAAGSGPAPLPDRRLTHGLGDLATIHRSWRERAFAPLAGLVDLTRELSSHRHGSRRSGSADKVKPLGVEELIEVLTSASRSAVLETHPEGLPTGGELHFETLTQSYRRQVLARFGPLLKHVPDEVNSDSLFEALDAHCEEAGLPPYDAQLEAFLAIVDGENVVLATPTGSGKSLVALAAHFVAFCQGTRSVYTAPTKALVNEKFFALCKEFGSQNVGLMTGDVSLNGDAPILCCTAEILSDMALGEGADTPFAWVVMDEFHYYTDRSRGIAWLIPLLEMRRARFLLMSASLGDPEGTRKDVEGKTGHSTQLVHSTLRPVGLEYEYHETTLLDAVRDVLVREITPAYIVCFSKKEAGARALQLKNMPAEDEAVAARLKQVRVRIKERLAGFRFDSPFGKWLRGILSSGIGVHHGGLLPKYRRLVEQLAKDGLLWLISGTDTLGVGVNLPIRTVMFTQLFKWEKDKSRKVSAREFHQIAGRAGRAGHDDLGTAIVLAPEHLVANQKEKAKAAAKSKKFHAQPEPRGYKAWDEPSFLELTESSPPPMKTRFKVSAPLVRKVLTRPGGGMDDLVRLIKGTGLGPEVAEKQQEEARHVRQSLLDNGSLTELAERDEDGRSHLATSEDSRSGRPLMLFMRDAVVNLPEGEDMALDLLSIVESVVETSVEKVLRGQITRERQAIYDRWCAEGDERPSVEDMKEEQKRAAYPQPCLDFIEQQFDDWSDLHPWLAKGPPRPCSIVRDMFERGLGFNEFVREDELMQEEGPLLRHCSEVYKVMRGGLPPFIEQDEGVQDLTSWLSVVVRQVDSSLLVEWERLSNPDAVETERSEEPAEAADITRQVRAFRVMVRNEAFRWIRSLSGNASGALKPPPDADWTVAEAMAGYWAEHDEVLIDAEARGPKYFDFDATTGVALQRILDPEGHADWVLHGQVDFEASREQGRAVLQLTRIENVGADG